VRAPFLASPYGDDLEVVLRHDAHGVIFEALVESLLVALEDRRSSRTTLVTPDISWR
jgi:hypothetical protein